MAVNALPIIIYKNVFETGTVTVTEEAAGFPKENLFDSRSYNLYKSTTNGTQDIEIDKGAAGTAVDALCISGHNLGTETATIEVFEDTVSNFATPTSLGSKAVTKDDPLFLSLTSGTERFNRIRITLLTTNPVQIGFCMLGARTTMPVAGQYGYDIHAQEAFTRSFNSDKGQFLGAQVSYVDRVQDITFRAIADSFVDSDLLPFLRDHYIESKPFFYVPDTANEADFVYFLRAPDNPRIDLPTLDGAREFVTWVMSARGVKDSDFT